MSLLLARDDDIQGLSIKDDSSMPRVYQALQLRHKDFVTHDSCQQHIRRVFYGDSETALRARDDSSFQHRSGRDLLLHAVMIPLYSLSYIVSRYDVKMRLCFLIVVVVIDLS